MPTQFALGPAIQPCPSNKGTAGKSSKRGQGLRLAEYRGPVHGGRTAIEATADSGDYDLHGQQCTHSPEDGTVFVGDGVDTDGMDGCVMF